MLAVLLLLLLLLFRPSSNAGAPSREGRGTKKPRCRTGALDARGLRSLARFFDDFISLAWATCSTWRNVRRDIPQPRNLGAHDLLARNARLLTLQRLILDGGVQDYTVSHSAVLLRVLPVVICVPFITLSHYSQQEAVAMINVLHIGDLFS